MFKPTRLIKQVVRPLSVRNLMHEKTNVKKFDTDSSARQPQDQRSDKMMSNQREKSADGPQKLYTCSDLGYVEVTSRSTPTRSLRM
jgi:hypothetical protein